LSKPAHRAIAERNLCWERVRDRLDRFEHIGKQFDIDELRKRSESPPYHCHYMAWRLGTWRSDHLFENADLLLGSALHCQTGKLSKVFLRTVNTLPTGVSCGSCRSPRHSQIGVRYQGGINGRILRVPMTAPRSTWSALRSGSHWVCASTWLTCSHT
jgi:hypothetical protein